MPTKKDVSLSDKLNKIVNSDIKAKLTNIAQNDGGKNRNEIDETKGYKELTDLLSGCNDQDDKNILTGLVIEYENKYGKPVDNTNIGLGGTANGSTVGRDANSGTGNAVNTKGNFNYGTGAGARTNGGSIIEGNNNVVGNNNTVNNYYYGEQIVSNNSFKIKIPAKDSRVGKVIALKIYSETNSGYAYNDVIKDQLANVDDKNAYSFFKEYNRLKSDNPTLMQDVYGVSDLFNRITAKDGFNAIKQLLIQADNYGLKDIDEYKDLTKQLHTIENLSSDPNKDQQMNLDQAIDALIEQMSKYIE